MILLIDKPQGITSFDCIRRLRRCFPRGTKIGHAGTLDPMATGLMIIGVGSETKRLGDYLKLPKTYEAEILLGVRTDTGDIDGKAVDEVRSMSYELWKGRESDIKETLEGMVGKLQLPVPKYSAVKRGGEPLYQKARRGEHVLPPIKTMEVTDCKLLAVGHPRENGDPAHNGPLIKVRFDVSSGTYIRSLAEEFGHRLGVPATLAGLRRTRIGEFKVEDAEKL